MPEAASAAFPLVACERRMQGMKLKRSNPHLKSGKAREFMLWQSAKSSSAVEGIKSPFEFGPHAWKPPTAQALIDYWKQRSSKSGR